MVCGLASEATIWRRVREKPGLVCSWAMAASAAKSEYGGRRWRGAVRGSDAATHGAVVRIHLFCIIYIVRTVEPMRIALAVYMLHYGKD